MNRSEQIQAARERAFAPPMLKSPRYSFCEAAEQEFEAALERVLGYEKWASVHSDLIASGDLFNASTVQPDANGYFWFSLPSVEKLVEMQRVLRHFAEEGWRRRENMRTDIPQGASTSIVYYLHHPNHKGSRLDIRSYLKTGTEAGACRLVEVGKKTVPIMEIQCPEGTLDE